ncbi:hypothetical protein [uncultured Microbacterium sp.]|uniref:hypothetical protein n=1 Tax=uncultured Microbacterium sp. TaxID=191216 RepID=UPI0028DD0C06|nr:hypothetical protein [uncultured Microbacterium sp.]
MTDQQAHASEPEAPRGLRPLPGTLDLLRGDADDETAGYCSGGVCRLPAAKKP